VGIATQNRSLYGGLDVTEKRVRMAYFHLNTMKALADFTGACGFTDPKALNPDVFFKRTEANQSQRFAELYFNKKPHTAHSFLSLNHS
jgi:hypothetical protein